MAVHTKLILIRKLGVDRENNVGLSRTAGRTDRKILLPIIFRDFKFCGCLRTEKIPKNIIAWNFEID